MRMRKARVVRFGIAGIPGTLSFIVNSIPFPRTLGFWIVLSIPPFRMKKSSRNFLVLIVVVLVIVGAWWFYRASPTAALIRNTARGLTTSSRETPVCLNIGTSKEGWFLGKALVKYGVCKSCVAECTTAGNRTGWYNSCDKSLIVLADCTTPVPPSQDQPYCRTSGAGVEGWFVRQRLVREVAKCQGCPVVCKNEGATEGWYDGCDDSLIIAAQCATLR
jgi:hypothetical protein